MLDIHPFDNVMSVRSPKPDPDACPEEWEVPPLVEAPRKAVLQAVRGIDIQGHWRFDDTIHVKEARASVMGLGLMIKNCDRGMTVVCFSDNMSAVLVVDRRHAKDFRLLKAVGRLSAVCFLPGMRGRPDDAPSCDGEQDVSSERDISFRTDLAALARGKRAAVFRGDAGGEAAQERHGSCAAKGASSPPPGGSGFIDVELGGAAAEGFGGEEGEAGAGKEDRQGGAELGLLGGAGVQEHDERRGSCDGRRGHVRADDVRQRNVRVSRGVVGRAGGGGEALPGESQEGAGGDFVGGGIVGAAASQEEAVAGCAEARGMQGEEEDDGGRERQRVGVGDGKGAGLEHLENPGGRLRPG